MPTIIFLFIVMYLVMPLVIYFSQKAKIHPEIDQINPESLPHEWSTFLYHNEKILTELGFSGATYLQLASAMPGSVATVVMMVNRHTGDKAMINVIFVKSGSNTQKTLYVEFSTRFADNRCFNTHNSKQLGSFKLPPTDTNTYVPSVSSLLELYQIHRMVMRESGVQGEKVTYPEGGGLAYLKEIWPKGFEEQITLGQYRRDEVQSVFRLTLVGAYRMTWMLLWPVSTIRVFLRWLNEQKVRSRLRTSAQEPVSAYFPPQLQTSSASLTPSGSHFDL